MAIINYINTGSGANSGDGDSLRTAFTKINLNFDSLVSSFVAAGVTSWNNRVGVVEFTNADLLTLLGYTPYPNTNPDGFVTSSTIALSNYATIDYVNTAFVFVSDLAAYNFASTNYVDLKLTEYPTLQYLDDQQYLTSINLPNFLTDYVTEGELATFGISLRDFTTNTVFQSVNDTSIIPAVADIYDLGQEAYRWSTLYLANAVYIQGIGISVDPTTGKLLVNGNDVTNNYNFTQAAVWNGNNSSFNISASQPDANTNRAIAGINFPTDSDTIIDSLTIYNTGTSGVQLTGSTTSLNLDKNGIVGLKIDGNLVTPVTLAGEGFLGSIPMNHHSLQILPNAAYGSLGVDLIAPQQFISIDTTQTHAPLLFKGSRVAMYAFTLTDIQNYDADIQFPSYLALDEDGVYIGRHYNKGYGDPTFIDSFEGYKLPLTRGLQGQILAIASTSTALDTVEWVTPSSGTSADLLNVSNHILPSANLTYDLGSTSSQWRSLYVGTSTIYLGGTALSVSGGNLTVDGSPVAGSGSATTSTLISGTYTVALSTSGSLTVPGHILPDTDVAYDLGSPTNRFRDIYVSSSTIYIGTSTISISSEGQMLVNGNAATSKVEYFGTEGFGPRDAIFSAWIDSKLFFASPGKELRQAIYDLQPGNPLSLYNDTLGLVNFTISGSAADVINTLGYGGQNAVEIPVAELNTYTNFSPQLYLHDIYLPVKDKSATIANGTWTVTVSTTGTIVYPDGTQQTGASISIAQLKTLVAASTDFADFKSRIAAL